MKKEVLDMMSREELYQYIEWLEEKKTEMEIICDKIKIINLEINKL